MPSALGHKPTGSVSQTQNQKAHLATAYNELGKELSSSKIRVVGNYTLGKVIGEGAYGKVRLGTHRLTSTRVAIKQIPKAMSSSLTREIHHHRQLHHPHVTQMYEVIATESSIWIVTELCCGGELFDYLVEKGRLSEHETRILFGQLCLAIAYLHEKGIVHRDLKLENVLLDEKCRVKLGDFGFTREFDRNMLLETFCGTTGYASPEMLQGKKYTGPEVDIWSLGIILYCLLTGTLPFDDDDEAIMRSKIIHGEFEDPEWLSPDARDLIANILVQDTTKRFTVAQILAHPWFTSALASENVELTPVFETSRPSTPDGTRNSEASTQSTTSDATFLSASSELGTGPTTPDDISSHDPFVEHEPHSDVSSDFKKHDNSTQPTVHANPSEVTIKLRDPVTPRKPARNGNRHPETVVEEELVESARYADSVISPQISSAGSGSSRMPPIHPVRTPARTKRRSVSSVLSDPDVPSMSNIGAPASGLFQQDFSSLLSKPTPIIFSTSLERNLLNSLSSLGFDTAQIVHSVLSDACDASGALWWIMKRKAEKSSLEFDGETGLSWSEALESGRHSEDGRIKESSKWKKEKMKNVSAGVQTDVEPLQIHGMSLAQSAPQLAFVPPTPTVNNRPNTPPSLRGTGARSPLLSPSSNPTTPAGSLKEREGGIKGRKGRSGSVSIMQRATTALEATGLMRKKSSEAVKDEKDPQHQKDQEKSSSETDKERKTTSGEDTRSSPTQNNGGATSSKLIKSPRIKAVKDKDFVTPPSTPIHDAPPAIAGSPWVITGSKDVPPPLHHHATAPTPTPANSPGDALPTIESINQRGTNSTGKVPNRNRANLLTAFRLWFHEDKKGKRKDASVHPSRPIVSPVQPHSGGTVKRRTSNGTSSKATRGRGKRPSISSRRSSSVNSRRSSGASGQVILLDSGTHYVYDTQPRRSLGNHTPNSERGDHSSRPSSINSISLQRHRKSPSASSAGSAHMRAQSPIQKYHRRGGSGSSTRVVRQIRPAHVRSSSATSSLHSPTSSRPPSWYEEGPDSIPRTGSPLRAPRRSLDDSTPRRNAYSSGSSTTFVAHKRSTPFMSPSQGNSSSMGRSSWKKSWGLEPPGWQTRTTHLPIEVLAISPGGDSNVIRDVITGRQSLNFGDESDWVDEDDDGLPAFAGGLGQLGSSSSSPAVMHMMEIPTNKSSTPSRAHRSKRGGNKNSITPSSSSSSGSMKQKIQNPLERRSSPVLSENTYESTSTSRRQLPAGRPGPAAIQEEDEDEEE